MPKHIVYQFYAELVDFKPKIWRRFQVSDDISVARLGYITQVIFEMKASHPMVIEVPIGEITREQMKKKIPNEHREDKDEKIWLFEIPDDDIEPYSDPQHNVEIMDATKIKLAGLTRSTDFIFHLNYDYGYDWWVTLLLEKVFEDNELPKSELPRVLEGENFGIVEDCGGTSGLADLVKAFKKKKGETYRDLSDWLGVEDFDITAFDIDDMNFRLKKLPRIYKQSYEDNFYPTQKSIDLIERKYLKK